jgi:flavorubredoxin
MAANIPAPKALEAIFQEHAERDRAGAAGKIVKIVRRSA